jgi:tetratricopeptide (TPR) repeat protein
MIINKRAAFGMALLTVFLCQTSLEAAEQRGRGRGGRGRGGQQQQQARNPFFPTVGSQQELEDYRAIDAEQSPITKLTLSETFLTTYPESELKHLIHRSRLQTFAQINNDQSAIAAAAAALAAHTAFYDMKMEQTVESDALETPDYQQFLMDFANAKAYYLRAQMDSYDRLSQFQQVVDTGEPALAAENEAFELYGSTADQSLPEYQQAVQQHQQLVMMNYQKMVGAHQILDNIDSIIEYSERALEIDPDSLPFLMMLSDTLASRPPDDEAEREEQMEVAQDHAEKALELVELLLSGPASMQMSAEQKSGLTTAVRATLGRIYFNNEEWDDAREEYQQAVEASPRDSASHFFLGLCYARENKADEALDALAKAVFLKGPEEAQARQTLQNIWETLNREDDMEAFIQEKGQSVGG